MKSKNKKKAIVDISESDGGDESNSNFRFQYVCTTLIALKMSINNTNFKEIYCELYEDILGVKEDSKFVGIQIKHRQKSLGPFTMGDATFKKTIKHFLKLEKKYPGKFEKFVIMSNAETLSFERKTLKFLIQQCTNNPATLSPLKLDSTVNKLAKTCDISKEELIQLLSKVETFVVTDRISLESEIISTSLHSIPRFKHASMSHLKGILNTFISLVELKSKSITDSLDQYTSFLENNVGKVYDDNAIAKRITKQDVAEILERGNTMVFLKPVKSEKLTSGNYKLIRKKLILGGIGESEITSMNNLAHTTETFVIENYYKNEDKDEVEKIDHVQTMLLNISAESETSAKSLDKKYGNKKLELIEIRLHETADKHPEQVFYTPYEILKGIVGLLMTKCRIDFSPMPKGGWFA